MFVILLTNRVYASRSPHPVKVIADVRSDLSDAASLSVTDMGDGALVMPASFRADREVGWNERERSRRHGRARHAKSLSSRHGTRTGTSREVELRRSRSAKPGKRAKSHAARHSSGSKHTSSSSKSTKSAKSKHKHKS